MQPCPFKPTEFTDRVPYPEAIRKGMWLFYPGSGVFHVENIIDGAVHARVWRYFADGYNEWGVESSWEVEKTSESIATPITWWGLRSRKYLIQTLPPLIQEIWEANNMLSGDYGKV